MSSGGKRAGAGRPKKPGGRKRDYKKEYAEYHSKPTQRRRNDARKKANRGKKCPKGQEVDHTDRNPKNNKKSNLRCVSIKKNRGWRKGKQGKAKGK